MITAEKIYNEIVTMPVVEREKLFSLIARKGFDKDYYTYEEVFGDIARTFTIKEAAAYLEVAEITTRRWAKEGKLPFAKVGKNFVFNVDSLREAKKKTAPTKACIINE